MSDVVQETGCPARAALIGGLFWGGVIVAIWSGWMVFTRFGIQLSLNAADLTFIRFTTAAAVFTPVLLKQGLGPAGGWRPAPSGLIMALGSGAPYALITASGLAFAPAADAGALIPGVMPVFVALFAFLVLRQRLAARQTAGYLLVAAGALALGGLGAVVLGDTARLWGHIAFVTGAAMWAVHTLVMRRCGYGAAQATALVAFYSTLGFAPVYLLFLESNLATAPLWELALQFVVQGLLTGALGMFAFGKAVVYLGPARGSALAALVPVATVLLGAAVLGEWPTMLELGAILAISAGVLLAALGPAKSR